MRPFKHASEQQPMKFYCEKVGGVSGEISTRPFDVTFGTPFVDKLEFCWRQIPDFCNILSIFQHITWKWTLNRDNKFEQTKHSERVDTYDVTRAPCYNQNGRHFDEQHLKSQGAQLMSTLLIKWKGRQLERKAAQKKRHPSSLFMMMKRLLICPPLASSRCNPANSVVPND
ncbi:conserved hypothetical protein [Trichinella spiralis]|uniref:hypothetical protein n=1 Tax=Trichinella spiralis TaxID=6334 RepID=UPI0001EFC568|nr:conserved hypothetical protein [Trichinella spiralis]